MNTITAINTLVNGLIKLIAKAATKERLRAERKLNAAKALVAQADEHRKAAAHGERIASALGDITK
jgi:hypothetical protein